jgi:hypothetical protein
LNLGRAAHITRVVDPVMNPGAPGNEDDRHPEPQPDS